MEPQYLITASGCQCEHYRSRVTLRCHARPCVATWVDWWRSVCLNAQRIKPSSLPRNSGRLRSSERYDCFARELRDYCDYPWRVYVYLGATGPAAWQYSPRSAALHREAVMPFVSAARTVRGARAPVADEHRRRNARGASPASIWGVVIPRQTRAAGSGGRSMQPIQI